MSDITFNAPGREARVPSWYWAAAAVGLAWNAYGVVQFAASFAESEASLMSGGMTAAQAALYAGLPAWMTLAFGTGVGAGLAGCVLLLLRRQAALPVFAVSFAGYLALFAGDLGYGVFAAIPAQLGILTVVMAVAAMLLATAWIARRRGILA